MPKVQRDAAPAASPAPAPEATPPAPPSDAPAVNTAPVAPTPPADAPTAAAAPVTPKASAEPATPAVDVSTSPSEADGEVKIVRVNPDDLLQVGEIVLKELGKPSHHTAMIAKAHELGIAGPKIERLNPTIWSDTRKALPHQSRFVFYGKSVFGLSALADPEWAAKYPVATYTKEDSTVVPAVQPEQYAPTRQTGGSAAPAAPGAPPTPRTPSAPRGRKALTAMSLDDLAARLVELQSEVTACAAEITRRRENPTATPNAPEASLPAPPPPPSFNVPPPAPPIAAVPMPAPSVAVTPIEPPVAPPDEPASN